MARGGRLPRAAGRPPQFLRTGHQRALSLSDAHLQAARGTPGTRSSVRPRVSFNRSCCTGPASAKAAFRVLAEGDPDVNAAPASAVGCSPPPRSLTPTRPPLSDQRGRAARRCIAAQIVRKQTPGGRRKSLADDSCFVDTAVCVRAGTVFVFRHGVHVRRRSRAESGRSRSPWLLWFAGIAYAGEPISPGLP
jgi:hypothetical protein